MKKYDEYKSSGDDWLGEIPMHWRFNSLKYLLKSKLKYGANEPAIDENKTDPQPLKP